MCKLLCVIDKKEVEEWNKITDSFRDSMLFYRKWPLFTHQDEKFILISFYKNSIHKFSNDDVTLIFFGKFFDKEIDDGSLLDSYLEGGIDFVRKLNGSFLIFIFDKKQKKVFVLNDRFGSKPLYYYCDGNRIVLSSEIKAMIDFIPKEINWDAHSDYFMYRFVLGNKTFFKNVFSLPNASILCFSDKGLIIESYWDFDEISIDCDLSLERIINEGVKIIKNVAMRDARGFRKCICFLSGGYDSRCIIASLHQLDHLTIKAFTTQHPTGIKDVIYAKEVADKLELEHEYISHPKNIYSKYFLKKIYCLDGMTQEGLWVLPIIDEIPETNLINFDGLAGDVLLKGLFLDNYNLKYFNNDRFLSEILSEQIGYDISYLSQFFDREIFTRLTCNNSIREELGKISKTPNRITIFFLKNRTKNAVALAPNNIISEKLGSIFFFLDNDLVDFSLRIPPDFKINKHVYYKMLKALAPELMEIPTTNDQNFNKMIINLFFSLLSRIHMLKKLKGNIKFRFVKPLKNREDLEFTTELCTNILSYPTFIRKERIVDELKRGKLTFGTLSVIEFLVWYNFFMIKNKKLKKCMLGVL